MKRTFALLSVVCLAHAAFAQTRYPLKPEHVTVFLKGAELYGKTKVTLVKGENEVVLTGISTAIDETSIMVNAGADVTIQSVSYMTNYLDTLEPTPAVQVLKDSLKQLAARKKVLANKVKAISDQLVVIQQNGRVNGENQNVSTVELKKLLDFMRTETEALLADKDAAEEALNKVNERYKHFTSQLREEQNGGEGATGKLVVKLLAKEAKATTVSASYVVENASWTPVYDIVADHPGQPLRMVYKANLRQGSGINWNNVRLSLSTGNPTEGMQPPTVDPWHISFYQPVHRAALYMASSAHSDELTEADSFDYSAVALSKGSPTYTWSKARAGAAESVGNYVSVDNGGVNTTFDIDLPYSIPNDNKEHLISVKHFDVPATYVYSAYPKQDKDAFLLARISNWHDLNMMAGETNIFYEGSYVGQGSISPDATGDTLDISLGRDKKIVITREQDKARRSVRTIGSNVRETYAYTITLRNNRKEAAQVLLTDQLPISDDKDITIEDAELSGAIQDEKTGAVKWDLTLKPNETREIKFGFTLKYPKGKTLENGPR